MGVPDTSTFTLQEVVDEVVPTTDDLLSSFVDSSSGYFDPDYSGYLDNSQLLFRNYVNPDKPILPDPGYDSLIFLRPATTSDTTIWMSDDGGVTWRSNTQIADNSWTFYGTRIVHCNHEDLDHIIFTFRRTSSTQTALVSHDRGVTFEYKQDLGSFAGDNKISNDGKYTTIFNWGSPFQMQQSSDYGENFSTYSLNAPLGSMSIDGQFQYANVDGGRIYRSTDWGQSFMDTLSGNSFRARVVCSFSGQYVARGENGSSNRAEVSQNYGLSFFTPTGIAGGSGSVGQINDIDLTGQYMVNLNGSSTSQRLRYSTDYGSTFSMATLDGAAVNMSVNRTLGCSNHIISSNGLILSYLSTDTVIYLSTDYGADWTLLKDFTSGTSVKGGGPALNGKWIAIGIDTATQFELWVSYESDFSDFTLQFTSGISYFSPTVF